MSTPPAPARIHLLAARKAPFVVIIRRSPSKVFHIIRWDTRTDKFEHGSWFNGKIYSKRCDVSFDGQWMVYLAMGSDGNTWNGCCALPFLKTYLEGNNFGSWNGGGMWRDEKTLLLNCWEKVKGHVPFQTEPLGYGRDEDLGITYLKMERDGWTRMGDNWGNERPIKSPTHKIANDDDDGWEWKPARKGPTLECFYRGYLEHGYTFEFRVREFPDVLTPDVEWATFDSLNNLVWSRGGWVYRASLADLRRGKVGFEADLNSLQRPERPAP
ncbi:hypothetical protein EON83_22825 [bacterium]|nr:MAG: hypothetical protein EON83_22825 [bacterium]